MSHDHDDHGHSHDHALGAGTRALTWALGLTLTFLVAEVLGAWWFSSLALLSDAAHMFTDSAALAIALAAARIGQMAPDEKRTYGYRRFEVLAAAFNASLLLIAAGWILFEAIRRFLSPAEVQPLGMMAIAVAGLVANFIGMRILTGHQEKSLNMKGAYLELWADALGSVGVILGAGLIWLTGLAWIDPVVAVAISFWVLPRSWTLLSDATHILMEGVPRGVDLTEIRSAIRAVKGIADVHDLHVWSVAGDDVSLTAHVVLKPGAEHETVRADAMDVLDHAFGIRHATLQTEEESCAEAKDHVHA